MEMAEPNTAEMGRPREYDTDDVFAVVRDAAPEPMTATEVADVVGCDHRTAIRRLREAAALRDEDDPANAIRGLQTKEVGANTRLFWYDPNTGSGGDDR